MPTSLTLDSGKIFSFDTERLAQFSEYLSTIFEDSSLWIKRYQHTVRLEGFEDAPPAVLKYWLEKGPAKKQPVPGQGQHPPIGNQQLTLTTLLPFRGNQISRYQETSGRPSGFIVEQGRDFRRTGRSKPWSRTQMPHFGWLPTGALFPKRSRGRASLVDIGSSRKRPTASRFTTCTSFIKTPPRTVHFGDSCWFRQRQPLQRYLNSRCKASPCARQTWIYYGSGCFGGKRRTKYKLVLQRRMAPKWIPWILPASCPPTGIRRQRLSFAEIEMCWTEAIDSGFITTRF